MKRLYSIDKILVYVGNDKQQCEEMIDLFLKTIPKEFEELENAIKQENWDKAYEISHRIKPSIEILQINNVVDKFFELNAKLHNKIDLVSIPELFSEINNGVNNAIDQIKKDYNF